jgi:Helix-turn-helix domain
MNRLRNQLLEDAVLEAALKRASSVQPLARRWMTSKEAAAYLGYANGDVLAVLRAQGRAPPHVGSGKQIRYDIKTLDEWMASRPTKCGCTGTRARQDHQ